MKSYAQSFNALAGESLHTLILGSAPGQASLQAQQYYAHPRNAFWPILNAIITEQSPSWLVHEQLSYEQRCSQLLKHGFGLWDVLGSCERPGSLDSAIVRSTEIPNDIIGLISQHPELHTIACNGRMAEKLLKRHVLVNHQLTHLRIVLLPSSSPAMASLTMPQKFTQWSQLLRTPE